MMKVGFNPSINFKASDSQFSTEPMAATISEAETKKQIYDEYSVQNSKKEKSFKESTASFWKFFTVANQMANAALKGIFYGALTGISFLTGSWLFKSLPKAFSKEGPSLWQTLRHPFDNISKSGKTIAGTATAVVLAYHLIKGKLDSNQKTAVIDHKLKVGHRDV